LGEEGVPTEKNRPKGDEEPKSCASTVEGSKRRGFIKIGSLAQNRSKKRLSRDPLRTYSFGEKKN